MGEQEGVQWMLVLNVLKLYLYSFLMARKAEKKQQKESSESQEEQLDVEDLDEDEALLDEHHDQEEDLHHQHQEVLQIIEAQTKEGTEGEKLTWLALYSLKQQEIHLNYQMQDQINSIKDKYDLLKQPIFQNIAAAATGNKVDSPLYKPEGLELPENQDQLTPSALPDFWLTVFTNSGIIEEEEDIQAFGKLTDFKCEILNESGSHLRLTFKFKEETSLFSNKQLTIENLTTTQETEVSHEIKVKESVKWKGKRNPNSVFTILFDSKSDPNDVAELMAEFCRDFSNSIYFYLRKGDLEIEGLEDDEEEPEDLKPAKKQKKDMQKPQCKQQ